MSGLLTEPNTVQGDDKSGDLSIGALYNFNTETLQLPAFAARIEVGLPTGVNSRGVDTELTGVMTRSFGRWRTHVNLGYTFLGSPQQNERVHFYPTIEVLSKISWDVNAPIERFPLVQELDRSHKTSSDRSSC